MIRSSSAMLLVLLHVALAFGQQVEKADVVVSAQLVAIENGQAELVVKANIADGLHIYAQTQPKPFLATKIDVLETSPGVVSVGEFKAEREAKLLKHPQLDVELHEFEGQVEWRALVEVAPGESVIALKGSLFAQACKADRCFAPKSYDFEAKADLVPAAKTTPAIADPAMANPAKPSAMKPSAMKPSAMKPSAKDSTTGKNTISGQNTNTLSGMTESAADSRPQSIGFNLDSFEVKQQPQHKTVWTVIPLAFVAGFLLNFMPCVLPVVGLKLLSFVQQANSDRRQILLMNLSYSAGLVSVMLGLATFAVFAGLGWGEQFSSPIFAITLSAIVFAFGLSLLGVWEIPQPFFASSPNSAKQESYGGAFSKGVLSTLLATPCSGPFLGAALAWAVSQPSYLTYGVFASVGVGMASPFLLVGMFPSSIRFLPKPGNWMVTFKHLMGFVMLATVVYLLSFVPVASVVPTISLLLSIAAAVWYASRTPVYAPPQEQFRAWGLAAVVAGIAAIGAFGWLQGIMEARFERAANRLLAKQSQGAVLTSSEIRGPERTELGNGIEWKEYSPDLLEISIREGRPVFVDFTADWCLTCKANEVSAIETEEVADALKKIDAVALRADKTEPNPGVDLLLRKLGNSAASIPFYAVFSANDPENPILLDGIFTTPEPFVEALEASGNGQTGEQASDGPLQMASAN